MSVQEDKTLRPWIVLIGLAKVPRPTKNGHFYSLWASGCIVGRRHILTAAHVCKNLDLARRNYKQSRKAAYLVCIPGFRGNVTTTTRIYPIQSDAFEVSQHCLHAKIKFQGFREYRRALQKVEHQNFYSNDLGMYFLDFDLPGNLTRAMVQAETDAYLDPAAKNSLMVHGYPLKRHGRLVFANTRCVKAFPAKIAMHAAKLGAGASGGPLWRLSSQKPTVIGVVSGNDQVNLGGPPRGWGHDSETGEFGRVAIDEETFKMTLLERLDPEPPEPDFQDLGLASRINGQTLLEIKSWLERR